MSWKVEVMITTEPGWHGNRLRFQTEAEASYYASEIIGRWILVSKTRVSSVNEPPTHYMRDGQLLLL